MLQIWRAVDAGRTDVEHLRAMRILKMAPNEWVSKTVRNDAHGSDDGRQGFVVLQASMHTDLIPACNRFRVELLWNV